MKKIAMFCLVALGLSALTAGCVPPPHQRPKPPELGSPPKPPGGPMAEFR
ncbi:MAG TPA: hypothetical protein VMH27_17500 [Puia sp.]|nr:hypothetical protein [Puia sp.]